MDISRFFRAPWGSISGLNRGHFEKLPVQKSGIYAPPLLHFSEENRLLCTRNNFGTIWSNFETAKFYIRVNACNLFVLMSCSVHCSRGLRCESASLFCGGGCPCIVGGTLTALLEQLIVLREALEALEHWISRFELEASEGLTAACEHTLTCHIDFVCWLLYSIERTASATMLFIDLWNWRKVPVRAKNISQTY